MQAAATPTPSAGGHVWRFLTSSLGAKVTMALTGLGFYAWLCLHMIGNLEIFHGAHFFNGYAHFLHSNEAKPLLWGSRVYLVVVVGLHILSGVRLWWLNRQARAVGYRVRRWRAASLASRTMIWTGVAVAVFVFFHLAHFTWGWFGGAPAIAGCVPPADCKDAYAMVHQAFTNGWVAAGYIVAMGLIGFHLWHAVWSALQTLGLNGPKWTPFAKKLGLALGVLLAVGFVLVPVGVLANFIVAH